MVGLHEPRHHQYLFIPEIFGNLLAKRRRERSGRFIMTHRPRIAFLIRDSPIQKVVELDVDMHGAWNARCGCQHGLVDHPVDIPCLFVVEQPSFRESRSHRPGRDVEAFLDYLVECSGLDQRLRIVLAYPLHRAVGGDDDERYALIISLGDRGRVVVERCPRGACERDGLMRCE